MNHRPAETSPHARTIGSLIAIMLAASLSTTAMAAKNDLISVSASPTDSDSKIASIKIADLDLRSRTGQVALRARLASAVREVCTFGGDRGPRLPVDRACAGDAAASAEQQARTIIGIAASGSRAASAMPATLSLHGAR